MLNLKFSSHSIVPLSRCVWTLLFLTCISDISMPENKSILISFCYHPKEKEQEKKDESKNMLSILSTKRFVTITLEGNLVCTFGLPVALVICVHRLLFHCDSFWCHSSAHVCTYGLKGFLIAGFTGRFGKEIYKIITHLHTFPMNSFSNLQESET